MGSGGRDPLAAVVFLAWATAPASSKSRSISASSTSGTVEARAAACAREVELNRKFAPLTCIWAWRRSAGRTAGSATTWW